MDKEKKRIAIQIVLFILTFITTTIAGAEWSFGKSIYAVENGGLTFNSNYTFSDFLTGLPYSVSFLLILSAHEFGHYFTARFHQIKTSLPYYIPLPPFPTLIGTLGALIRIRQRIPTTTQNFDIGIAGPLAGFVTAILVLTYGLSTLPPPEYIFAIHPEYEQFGLAYAQHVYSPEFLMAHGVSDMMLANNVIINSLASILADPLRMPNPHEMMHYPLLFAGYLSLLFTALNLLPIGQLDGGHVVYGLFGAKIHRVIASTVFIILVFFAGFGMATSGHSLENMVIRLPLYLGFLYFTFLGLGFTRQTTIIVGLLVFLVQYLVFMLMPTLTSPNFGFLLLTFLLGRFMGVRHPGTEREEPLTQGRKILGWIALAILVLCFTPNPITVGA